MKFYKIVNPSGHFGLIYKEGINEDPLPFYPYGINEPGGIYFSREHIFAFIDYGTELYEVEPLSEIYENPSYPKKWKSKIINLKYIGKVVDNIKFLVEQGADIHVCDDYILMWACDEGYLNIIKYLIKMGANINANDDYALRAACANGNLDIVKFLIKNGANVQAQNNKALKWAQINGHKHIVKYLIKNGANF